MLFLWDAIIIIKENYTKEFDMSVYRLSSTFSSTAAPPPRTHHPHRAARATRDPDRTAPHRGPLAGAARITARTGPREAAAPPTRHLHHPTWRRQLRQRRTTKNRTRKFLEFNLKP